MLGRGLELKVRHYSSMALHYITDVPEKMAFRLAKNNSHLPVLLREFFRCCVFTVKNSSVNMQHPHFTVNMQHLLTDLLTDYTD